MWKLMDIPGTQSPLSNSVVNKENCFLLEYTCMGFDTMYLLAEWEGAFGLYMYAMTKS